MINSKITDGGGTNKRAEVVENSRGNGGGLKVYSYDAITYEFDEATYTNNTYGSDMAINAAFSGTPDNVHNGTDNVYWTASALSGSWNFASTTEAFEGAKSIDATSTVNNSQALLTRGSTIDLSGYLAFSGQIFLQNWSTSGTKDVSIVFRNGGVVVSDIIYLSNYIDTALLGAWQSLAIPLSDFNLSNNSVDQIVITTIDIGSGAPPSYYLDLLQIQENAGEYIYEIVPEYEDVWDVFSITFIMADALAGTLANGTMPALSYNKILGVSSLSNGIQLQQISNKKIIFNSTIKDLFDLVSNTGEYSVFSTSDGKNTMLRVTRSFHHPIKLIGRTGDKIRFILNDDLSGLERFKCLSAIRIYKEEV